MVRIEDEIIINRRVEEVFDFVADERHEPRYNPRMVLAEQITPGPIGAGTRFSARSVSLGRPVDMIIEFTVYDRPRRLGSRARLPGMDIDGVLTFDPVPNGTRMRWSWELRPHGALRLLTPLVAWVGRRQEASIWTGLKRYLEAQTIAPSTA